MRGRRARLSTLQAMKRVLVVLLAVVASAALIGLLVYGLGSREEDLSIEQALARGERPAAPSRELAVLGEVEHARSPSCAGRSWC